MNTYEFYVTEYGGSLDEALFSKYEKRATFKLDSLTYGNITKDKYDECEKQILFSLCAIIDEMVKIDNAMKGENATGAIKSMSSGGQSVTYADNVYTKAISDPSAQDALYIASIQDYLYDTGLLYAGV